MSRRAAPLLVAVLVSACTVPLGRPVSPESDTTFTAHREHDGIVIDDFGGGRRGEMKPPSLFHWPGSPLYDLTVGGERVAGVWRSAERVDVAAGSSRDQAPIGEAVTSWHELSVLLTLRPTGGGAFTTDEFVREGGGTGFATLTRAAQTNLDVRGTYRATVHEPGGAPAGWIRVRITPYQEASRIYDAKLPPSLPPEVVAAAMVGLDAEIDWITDHALDIYRGQSGGGSLERSVPAPQ